MTHAQPLRPILLIEQDDNIRTSLLRLLEFEGYSTYCLSELADLSSLAKGQPPALVIYDASVVSTGDSPGRELLRQIREVLGKTPLLIIQDPERGETVAAIADVLLRQPVDLDVLMKFVRLWCGAPRLVSSSES